MARNSFMTRTIAFLIGIVGTLLVLEGILRLLPVLGGIYAAEPSASWPVHTMLPNTRFTYSSSWNLQNIHRGRINNFGYVAPFDYRPGSGGVVVFGDSYVESTMNAYDDTLQGSLNDYLKNPQTVMSFGMAGAEMPDYLGTAEIVGRHFSPRWAVFVISVGDFTRGFSAAPGYFKWQPSRSPPIQLVPEITRSGFTKWLRTVALVRYLRGNLALQPSQLIHLRPENRTADAPCENHVLSMDDEALLAAFARGLPAALAIPASRVVLVFDSNRKAIYEGKSQAQAQECLARPAVANERLKKIAAELGMNVIDSYPVFQRYFEAEHRPLDRSPLDAHWNAAAHRLLAREVADIIER